MSDLSKYSPEELKERLKCAILSMTDEQLEKLEDLYKEYADDQRRNALSD